MSGHLKATNEELITINSLPVDSVLSNTSVNYCLEFVHSGSVGCSVARGGSGPPPIFGNLVNRNGSCNM